MFTSTVGAALPLWNHSMCTPVHTGFVGFTGNNALGALAHLAGVPGGGPSIPVVVLPPSIYTACQTFNPELNIHSSGSAMFLWFISNEFHTQHSLNEQTILELQ